MDMRVKCGIKIGKKVDFINPERRVNEIIGTHPGNMRQSRYE
jgi:hypothetical protein